jgi:hypothetical protein
MDSLFSELMIFIMESGFFSKSKMELREKLTMNKKNLQSLLTKQVTMKIS